MRHQKWAGLSLQEFNTIVPVIKLASFIPTHTHSHTYVDTHVHPYLHGSVRTIGINLDTLKYL